MRGRVDPSEVVALVERLSDEIRTVPPDVEIRTDCDKALDLGAHYFYAEQRICFHDARPRVSHVSHEMAHHALRAEVLLGEVSPHGRQFDAMYRRLQGIARALEPMHLAMHFPPNGG